MLIGTDVEVLVMGLVRARTERVNGVSICGCSSTFSIVTRWAFWKSMCTMNGKEEQGGMGFLEESRSKWRML